MSAQVNRQRLFLASCLALIVTSMSFAIRGGIVENWESAFSLSKAEVGWVNGAALWGFTLSMVIGGPLCDVFGMKRMVWFAFIGHAGGILLTIFASNFATLYAGTLAVGIANGFVEAACNPLIATVYPEEKTKKLNQFHVWFPGGVVIGGLALFGISKLGLDGSLAWQVPMATMLVPLAIYGFLFLGQDLPKTERVASGVSTGEMFRACLRPLFIIMLLCMLLTASTELGTGSWIANILTYSAGVAGILVLVWINGLMAIGRQFCGPIVHRLSPSGMLFGSAILATVGLFLMSRATGALPTFAAATVFAAGICYFWPTMLGFVAERMPKTGALGLSTMGGAGMLAVALVVPVMGSVYDAKINETIPEEYVQAVTDAPFEEITSEQWGKIRDPLVNAEPDSPQQAVWFGVQAEGGAATLAAVSVLPVSLIVVFGVIFFRDKASGGYKAEALGETSSPAPAEADRDGSDPERPDA